MFLKSQNEGYKCLFKCSPLYASSVWSTGYEFEAGISKMSANGSESSGVRSCTVSTLLLVSKWHKKGGRTGLDHLGKAIFHEHCYPNAQQETYWKPGGLEQDSSQLNKECQEKIANEKGTKLPRKSWIQYLARKNFCAGPLENFYHSMEKFLYVCI